MKRKSDEHLSSTEEKQGELFAEFQESSAKKPGYLFRQNIVLGKKFRLNLSYENIVLFFIVFIILLVIFFSLGMEKGKRIALQSNKAVLSGRVHKVVENEAPVEEKKDEIVTSNKDERGKFEIIESSKMIEKKGHKVPAKLYTIQVVAFKKEKNAKKEMERLKNEGYEVFIIPSKDWLQVCVGRYTDREESKKDLGALKKRYSTCFVRKTDM